MSNQQQSSDKLTAAILRLQASAIECFSAISDRNALPTQEGDVDFIAQQFMRLANIEGALITLQQYMPDIRAHKASLMEQQRALEPEPAPEPEPEPEPELAENADVPTTGKPLTSKDLEKRSATFRRSQENRKKKKKSDES